MPISRHSIWSNLVRLSLVAVFCWSAGNAAAQDVGALCVQRQMQAAGFDPGPIDGIPGRQTRRAVAAFFEQRQMDVPVFLTRNNTMVLCRQIGLADPDLQAIWPSREMPVRITASGNIDAATEGALYGSALKTLQRFRENYGIELAIPIDIVIADNARDLERLLRQRAEAGLRDVRAQAEHHCSTGNGVSGIAYFDLLGVCIDPGTGLGRGLERQELNRVVAHEIFHAIQAQLVGHGRPSRDGVRGVQHRGPLWLTEGTASVVAEVLIWRNAAPDRLTESLYNALLGLGWPRLEELEGYPNSEEETQQLYRGGSYAVAVELSPTEDAIRNLLGYYEDIGLGQPWSEAFEERFGYTPEAFYEFFATLGPENKDRPADQK